jgi:hypothetical protein
VTRYVRGPTKFDTDSNGGDGQRKTKRRRNEKVQKQRRMLATSQLRTQHLLVVEEARKKKGSDTFVSSFLEILDKPSRTSQISRQLTR